MPLNVITNSCVGARIYQEKNMIYGNPFMWSIVPPDDFLYLYKNYDRINFGNYELTREGEDYKIIIDGRVNVYYVHYRYDENSTVPTVRDEIDVYYNKIEDYIKEKYETRLKRMTGKPVFIVSDREFYEKKWCTFTRDDLLNYVGKEDCIVATCDRSIVGKNVVYTPAKIMNPKDIAEIILKNKNL